MNLILFDDPKVRTRLLPLTYTRPVCDIRVGIMTIKEKWARITNLIPSVLTEDYLTSKYQQKVETVDNLLINSAVCPDKDLWTSIQELKPDQALYSHNILIAVKIDNSEVRYPIEPYDKMQSMEYRNEITYIERPWHIFLENGYEIQKDFDVLTRGRTSLPIDDPYTAVYSRENIFVEEGAKIKAAVLNAENGPIYVGKNVEIQEGSIIQGTAAFAEGSVVTLGAKIRDNTTIGPFSKVGGEIKNSIVLGYSNKQHEGFLGNSVVGEWCNIGADANISNLKNNYANVKVWDYETESFLDTGLMFSGLIMGDHSKCGINTMINTGTVIGVGCNIYGSGFPRNFIPSFSWGGAGGFTEFRLNKFYEVAERAMSRRNINFTDLDRDIITHVSKVSAKYRRF